ncbi:hypothetical protein AB0E21_05190 [Streptomyces sp. NPDC047967]|uniref:hypothetical protein n=1 Tax=Streptomyces sp. NPDC047967 TaxID=3154924 RepID=UPI0033F37577
MTESVPATQASTEISGAQPAPSPAESGEEKWKALSRENERKWKAASRELEELRKTQMSDQEKALDDARAEARKAALSEVGARLARAEIRVQASKAGVEAPTDYLDLSQFLGDDGETNTEKVSTFIASLKQNTPKSEAFPQLNGVGHHQSASEVSSMDPTELADLIAGKSFI